MATPGRYLTPAEAKSGKYKGQVIVVPGKNGKGGGLRFKDKKYEPKAATADPNKLVGYTGNGGKPGELPKRDAAGRYSWIDSNGKEQHQEGYDPATGNWSYLGEHKPGEWTAATGMFSHATPPTQNFTDLSQEQKDAYLKQAGTEMANGFMAAVQGGQNELVASLGEAVKSFADNIGNNTQLMGQELRNAANSIEASGLSFSGVSKENLGEAFSSAGRVSAEDMAKIQENLAAINALPGTATYGTPGTTTSPTPPGIDQVNNPETGKPWTDAEKVAAWDKLHASQEWTDYMAKVNAAATSGTNTGATGTGQYGYFGNLDPFAGTSLQTQAAQGLVANNRTRVAESYRSDLNARARQLGTTAEGLLGTSNLTGLKYPTLGGQSIMTPGANIFGSAQSGFQSNVASRANELNSAAFGQMAYTFPTSL